MRKLAIFRRVFLVTHWLRERLTATGLRLAALTGFAGAFGLDTTSNLAHVLFSLGFGLLAVDAVFVALIRRRVPRLKIRRHLPEFVSNEERASYRLEVQNPGLRRSPPQALVEKLQQPWPDSVLALQGLSGTANNRFDQRVGYPAYLALLSKLRGIDLERIELPSLLPGQRVELSMSVLPTARGLAKIERLDQILTGPLGLVEARLPLPGTSATLPVLPKRLPVTLPPVASHRLVQPGGIALALHVGDSEEFRSLRDYRPGDPLRNIHWRSFARTGKPMVRENQQEFFSRHALVLDSAASALFDPVFETAVSIAAGLVVRPRDADSLLDLMFVGDRVHRLTAGRGLGGGDGLLRVLATVQPTSPDSIERLLATLEQNAGQLTSIIAIFLAWDAARQNAIERLLALGLRPLVLLVCAEQPTSDELADRFAGIVRRITIPSPTVASQASVA